MDLFGTISEVSNKQKKRIETIEVNTLEKIPKENDINLETDRWFRIEDVVSLYIDMTGSTQLSNEKHAKTCAKVLQLFTGALSEILRHEDLQADFVDIKGDGGFALWKGKYASARALIASVTFRTAVVLELKPIVKTMFDWQLMSHCGIAKGDVLAKRIGTRDNRKVKRNWVVWAGKPVNNSCKLSDKAEPDTLLVTKDVYKDIEKDTELSNYLIMSCVCGNNGTKENLWEYLQYNEDVAAEIYKLSSFWCEIHGNEYINNVLAYINENEKS